MILERLLGTSHARVYRHLARRLGEGLMEAQGGWRAGEQGCTGAGELASFAGSGAREQGGWGVEEPGR